MLLPQDLLPPGRGWERSGFIDPLQALGGHIHPTGRCAPRRALPRAWFREFPFSIGPDRALPQPPCTSPKDRNRKLHRSFGCYALHSAKENIRFKGLQAAKSLGLSDNLCLVSLDSAQTASILM